MQSSQEITEIAEERFQQVGAKRIKILESRLRQVLSCLELANEVSSLDPLIIKHLRTIYLRLHKPAQARK